MNGQWDVVFHNRDYTSRPQLSGVTYDVTSYEWHVVGGPNNAAITAYGPIDQLWQLLGMLRCPVEIFRYNSGGDPQWYGCIDSVTVHYGGRKYTMSLSNLYNSIRVAYTKADGNVAYLQESARSVVRQERNSIQAYGVFDMQRSVGNMTVGEVEALLDRLIEQYAWPRLINEIDDGGVSPDVAYADITCIGHYQLLGMRRLYDNEHVQKVNNPSDPGRRLLFGLSLKECVITTDAKTQSVNLVYGNYGFNGFADLSAGEKIKIDNTLCTVKSLTGAAERRTISSPAILFDNRYEFDNYITLGEYNEDITVGPASLVYAISVKDPVSGVPYTNGIDYDPVVEDGTLSVAVLPSGALDEYRTVRVLYSYANISTEEEVQTIPNQWVNLKNDHILDNPTWYVEIMDNDLGEWVEAAVNGYAVDQLNGRFKALTEFGDIVPYSKVRISYSFERAMIYAPVGTFASFATGDYVWVDQPVTDQTRAGYIRSIGSDVYDGVTYDTMSISGILSGMTPNLVYGGASDTTSVTSWNGVVINDGEALPTSTFNVAIKSQVQKVAQKFVLPQNIDWTIGSITVYLQSMSDAWKTNNNTGMPITKVSLHKPSPTANRPGVEIQPGQYVNQFVPTTEMQAYTVRGRYGVGALKEFWIVLSLSSTGNGSCAGVAVGMDEVGAYDRILYAGGTASGISNAVSASIDGSLAIPETAERTTLIWDGTEWKNLEARTNVVFSVGNVKIVTEQIADIAERTKETLVWPAIISPRGNGAAPYTNVSVSSDTTVSEHLDTLREIGMQPPNTGSANVPFRYDIVLDNISHKPRLLVTTEYHEDELEYAVAVDREGNYTSFMTGTEIRPWDAKTLVGRWVRSDGALPVVTSIPGTSKSYGSFIESVSYDAASDTVSPVTRQVDPEALLGIEDK